MREQEEPMLSMQGISKSFGAVRAIQRVDLDLYCGEIVGLVGDNGSGKTTLMKVASGIYQPDTGKIYFAGKETRLENRLQARNMGIGMVYQDLGLCESVSIAENMFMGRELTKNVLGLNILDKNKMNAEATRCLNNIGISMPHPRTKVRNLSGGQQKAIAVERSVYYETKVTIMDEPTAALAVKEQRKILEIIGNLKKRNIGVIFITHTIDEVLSVSDRIVVLSVGRKVVDKKKSEISKDEIIRLMII